MKLLFFDLETTGTMYWRNGIHQISGIIDINGDVVEEFDYKVRPNPACTIEQPALDVAGKTFEEVNAYPPMEKVYKEFTTMLGKYVDKFNKQDKFFLCGYNNSPFDNQFLRAFFKQNGDEYFGSWFWSNSIDVMVLASDALRVRRYLMANFQLRTVSQELGIEVDESKLHDAMYDVYLTRQMYYTVKSMRS